MIVLFTDFGADDIYVAQVKARLLETAPAGTVVTDLLHSVPDFDPRAGAHLLAALQSHFPRGTVFLAVIDPGVGSTRGAAVMKADERWFEPYFAPGEHAREAALPAREVERAATGRADELEQRRQPEPPEEVVVVGRARPLHPVGRLCVPGGTHVDSVRLHVTRTLRDPRRRG